MKLSEITGLFRAHGLRPLAQALPQDIELSGAPMTDNRLLSAGDIFVCIKGFSTDGHSFVPDALARGAALIVTESQPLPYIPAIRVTDTRKAAALLAKLYFQDPAASFRLVGVTGTNGKTSTSLILFEALRAMGYKAGWIGTLGYRINDESFTTSHTTPDILELNRIFADMRTAEVNCVVMEVSSHAIALDRVYGVEFDFCLFTNLSRDHLDFHGNMEEYGKVKASFFDQVKKGNAVAVINTEDPFGATLAQNLSTGLGAVYPVGPEDSAYAIDELECGREGVRFNIVTREGGFHLRSPLIGGFNAHNLALVAATLHLMGFDGRDISGAIASSKPVPGRMQSVTNHRGIGVFVDYAHTPDAIETVLKTCRELPHRRVLCLMGAGGDRDQGKRPLMLSAALRHADAVIIADDNPRTENPDSIILDIISGSHPELPWWIIRDRKLAIESILNMAQADDIVVICGKGHETYQEIEGVRHHFDDAETARNWLDSSQPEAANALALPIDELTLRILNDGLSGLRASGYTQPRTYRHISTDTRSIVPGSVFFALKGERFDAHAFLGKALDDPSNFALGELALPEHERYLQVASSMAAMAGLHAKYLAMFDVYKVGLTGSTGKTSTKEILANICTAVGPTLKTVANENNIIGLCQTIRRIRPEHRFGVFELGINHFGEMAEMASVLKPDAAMVINIGPSHLEALGNEEGVYREKSVLLRQALQIRLFDGDDSRFSEFLDSGKGVGYSEDCDYRITGVQALKDGYAFKVGGHKFSIPFAVPHMIANAAFGIAFALEKGIAPAQIQAAMQIPLAINHRLQSEPIPGNRLLIIDCYNANPVSMHKALEYWINLEPSRPHLAILGDMLELGTMAAGYHQMIGAILAEMKFDGLITVGEQSRLYHRMDDASAPAAHYSTTAEAIQRLGETDIPKSAVILLKASHGIGLEAMLPALRNLGPAGESSLKDRAQDAIPEPVSITGNQEKGEA